jgi:hypothetical protein
VSWSEIGLLVCFLLVLDGSVALLLLDRVEPWVRETVPWLKVMPIAAIEIVVGGAGAILLLCWS